MTLKELSETYGYSQNTIKTKFKRTSEAFKKKYGLELVKCNNYEGTFYEVFAPRALTIYEEIKDEIYIPINSLKMSDLACFVLIGIAAMPQCVFRDTKEAFLDYLGLSHNKRNVELLDETLEILANQSNPSISYEKDKKTITVKFKDDFEAMHIITVRMLKECQAITKKYNKQAMKVIQLVKVWQAYRINQIKGINPLTDEDLQRWIDLSKKQILDAKKLLNKQNIIKMDRVGSYNVCEGTLISSNGYFDNKMQVIKE